MILFRSFAFCAVALLVMLTTPLFSQAAPSISVEQNGIITANDLNGVAGIELAIGYDASLFSTPTVTKGTLLAKAMLVANTSIPGTIKIAILSLPPFSGSGQLASIAFGPNSAKGGIKTITVSSMIDAKGVQIPVQSSVVPLTPAPTTSAVESAPPVLISTPGVPFTSATTATNSPARQTAVAESVPAPSIPSTAPVIPAATPTIPSTSPVATPTVSASAPAATPTSTVQTPQQSASTNTATPKVRSQTVVNTVIIATDSLQEKPESNTVYTTSTDQASAAPVEQRVIPADPPPSPDREQKPAELSGQTVIFKSIADRFKTYRGDKSLPIMAALFRKEPAKFIHQEPSIALSDGKSGIKIIIDLSVGNTASPNFALDNAMFLSVKKDNEINGRWIIEAMPDANVWKAALNIIVGADSFEYPLTVAPPVGAAIKADQAGWDLFMKKSGSTQKLSYDFNHDGIVDYIDEYIFVANHLAAR